MYPVSRQRQRRYDPLCFGLLVLPGLMLSVPAALRGADRILLRNLDLIRERTVTGMDEDGVRLDNRRLLTWDEIERGTVGQDKQAEFDRLLQELGGPLYRIRLRLQVGDYRELLPHAEALYPHYATRRSKSAYMVTQALMWSRLAVGRREDAVPAYLRCYELLRSIDDVDQVPLPGPRRLRWDLKTGMSPELAPVWFDARSAKRVLPEVLREIARMQQPRPDGAGIYYATLALAAGEAEAALRLLEKLKSEHEVIEQLRQLALAQHEIQTGKPGPAVTRLELQESGLAPASRVLALYWLGRKKLLAPVAREQREGVLRLLSLPAIYGDQYPELAAAGLFQSLEALTKLNDPQSSAAVRRELLDRYGQTFYADRVRRQLSPDADP